MSSGIQPQPEGLPGASVPYVNETRQVPPVEPTPDAAQFEHPLRPICAAWDSKIKLAWDWKQQMFGNVAAECMKFFTGPYDFLYTKEYASKSKDFQQNDAEGDAALPAPTFAMTVNKVAEMVQIFGPVLYHKNPDRKVNAREIPRLPFGVLTDPMDPMGGALEMQLLQESFKQQALDQARSVVVASYINWTPAENNLKDHSRQGIDECLIKGMGLLWTEVRRPPGSNIKIIGSFYGSVDELVIDPDAESIDDAKWIARRCVHPTWEVERMYGLKPGALANRGNVESANNSAYLSTDPDFDYLRKQGRTNDLIVYWKVYSKMGMGERLTGVDPAFRNVLGEFGDFVHLVVAEGIPFPLNVPNELIDKPGGQEEVKKRVMWPTPFFLADQSMGGWPFTPLIFHKVPRRAWPMSHMQPALGELKFLNWAYSMVASKMRIFCRDFLAIKKIAGDEIKDRILNGRDYTLIEIEATHPGTIAELVQFLSHPGINGDVWKVIEMVQHNFELRTGLTELIYGESARQMRSAEEANLKGEQLQLRPEDMATRVEEWMTEVARKEAIAARWHLAAQDVLPALGPIGAYYWSKLVSTMDLYALAHQLEYRIEAGSAKKPNRDRDVQNWTSAMTNLFQPLFAYAQGTGDVKPVNAILGGWSEAVGIDPEKLLLQAPPPPPPPAPPGAGGKEGGGPPGGGGAPPPDQQQQQAPPQGPPGGGPPAAPPAAPMPGGPGGFPPGGGFPVSPGAPGAPPIPGAPMADPLGQAAYGGEYPYPAVVLPPMIPPALEAIMAALMPPVPPVSPF